MNTDTYTYRFDIINHLINKYGFTKYLEIGVEDAHCFNLINCHLKHSIDPFSDKAVFKITSDEFFDIIKHDIEYDLIFIDGLHTFEQSIKDINNALLHIKPNGYIVIHDCNPPTEWHQRSYEEALKNNCRLWNGTVWKSFVLLRMTRPDLHMFVVDTDWGCGIIKFGNQDLITYDGISSDISSNNNISYHDFDNNRTKWLNLITVEQFYSTYS